jgi:hypothetical protein
MLYHSGIIKFLLTYESFGCARLALTPEELAFNIVRFVSYYGNVRLLTAKRDTQQTEI